MPHYLNWTCILDSNHSPANYSDKHRICFFLDKSFASEEIHLIKDGNRILSAIDLIIDNDNIRKLRLINLYNPPRTFEGIKILSDWLDQHNNRHKGTASAALLNNSISFACRINVAEKASAYEAEVQAINIGLDIISNEAEKNNLPPFNNVNIFSDNQATLQVIANPPLSKSNQSTFIQIFDKLNILITDFHFSISLLILWCPAHVGIPENKKVNQLAKEATEGNTLFDLEQQSRTLSNIQQIINSKFSFVKKKDPIIRNHISLSNIPIKIFNSLNRLERRFSSTIYQLRSGHSPLNDFLFHIDKIDSPDCSHYQSKEDNSARPGSMEDFPSVLQPLDGQRVSVADTRYPLADTRQCQRIPANGCGWPLFRKKLAGIRVSQRIPAAGRGDGRLEGSPSGRRGTSTSSTGRTPFQSTRYKYLAGWKETLPAGPLEGGYPRIPARIPAAADGYPPAGADADSDAQMAGKSSRISASARISGCQSTISTPIYPIKQLLEPPVA
ncbi:hypothetical protein PGTUg99_014349 [Puccinia graminis f. sp. tritici]|uniref:RNase H type-1 domain-containing protein n=1 Tax=Puccinia graminis f. sp. tritici TaxID=56615 RepID=A0A5B0QU05_PUCGR|nr:hypothetical protein PGTUg99_014349 [Puccinia graminis f. sp. tritici]